ncbi:MAG TPA: DUF5103 domain-containing protein [Bacteroidales bacterium]|nr:DUF5103 domain-containing protein [Bacteroidales bacterium]
MRNWKLLITCSLLSMPGKPDCQAAADRWRDQVLDEKIRTVLLYREGWNLSYPVIRLNSGDWLVLDFDLLSDSPETYYYSFIHCDRDWNESPVFPTDYIDGLQEDQIEDYKQSFNTTVSYYHYRLAFPGERMKPRIAGNYILKVYITGNPDKPVITKRFMITDESAGISGNVTRPLAGESYNTGQQVNFTVSFPGLKVSDAGKEIRPVVLQNGKWYDAKYDLKPDLVNSNELRFGTLSQDNIFPGGNEYRYFDIKSIHYQTEYIRKIDFSENRYHVFLTPSENREFKPYFFDRDLNGNYYVAVKEGKTMETDADYLYVYFTVPSANKLEGGELYVSGALANWEFNNTNRMIYDQSKGEYQCSMLLKQGWYNFEYIFIKDDEEPGGPSAFEGNHFETENDYLILIYYRKPGDRYDSVVAASVIKSTG